MARSITSPKIDTRTHRLKLEVGKKHWAAIAPELSIGYRKPKTGSGVWICRIKIGGKEPQFTIGPADDFVDADGHSTLNFHQAQDKCRERAALERQPAHMKAADMTVGEVVSKYLEHYEARGGKAGSQAKSSISKYITGPLGNTTIGNVMISELTPAVIKNWQHRIATTAPTGRGGKPLNEWEPTQENLRKRKDTANRVRTNLIAALNWGFEHGLVADDTAWRKTKPFKAVDQPIIQFIGADDCVRLLNACDEDFRQLVRAGLLTGARYGELIALKVGNVHLDKRFIQIVEAKGGKPRTITLNAEGIKFFEGATQGKDHDGLVFTRGDGKAWGKSHQTRRFADALERAGLSSDFSFHDLRHSFASLLIQVGVPIEVISDLLGHADTRITLRHYAHLVDSVRQDAVAKLPSFGMEPATNVVKLTRKAG
jgi:Site-specific recombinase XerD